MTRRNAAWLAFMLAACANSGGDAAVTTDLVLAGSETVDVTATEPAPTGGDALPDIMTSTGGETGGDGGGDAPGISVCSDGFKGEGEACDDGYALNDIANACGPDCQPTSCGDGYIQAGEACDNGEANSDDPPYGGCTKGCTLGPHCGDGAVQPETEECEPGDARGAASCSEVCQYFTRIIFLASEPTSGALGGLTGKFGADERCQGLARAAGLAGVFKAWLLVDKQEIGARFFEFEDFAEPIHFRTPDNTVVAESFLDLLTKGPAHALATTEAKQHLHGQLVWTNITVDGLFAGGDCGGWMKADTSAARVGHSGYSDETGMEHKLWLALRRWTDISFKKQCSDSDLYTYCVQVGD